MKPSLGLLLICSILIIAVCSAPLPSPSAAGQGAALSNPKPVTQNLEARSPQIGIVVKFGELVAKVVGGIKRKIEETKNARSQYTKQTVEELFAKNPHQNYVIVHTDHSVHCDGQKHQHVEFNLHWLHKTTGYEIYSCGAGIFDLKGDGGWLNWAWQGFTNSAKTTAKHVEFVKPP